jgi:ABC-2 type transport system ATP-binding protein
MIKISSLSKKFGALRAVSNLNLDINSGEFYCLLGPNGAGKTTTLKIAAGLMQPDAGRVVLNGLDISLEPLKVKQCLGFVPDTPFLYDNLTVGEFLDFVADIFAVDKKLYCQRRQHYFNIFNLDELGTTFIRELSHGNRQKVVYISNFIHSPQVYLIDEPLVGLDPYSIHRLKKILKEETAQGKTILMCTHILSIAEELADRIGILDQGRLIAQGTVQELKSKSRGDSLEKIFLQLTCRS